MQLEGQGNHAKDSRQEGFHIGGHKRKEARGGKGDGTGGARLEIKSLKHLLDRTW